MPKWHDESGRTPGSPTGSRVWSEPSATAGRPSTRSPAGTAFGTGSVDLLFIDHEKSVYLSDLQGILDRGWLHKGSIAVADNVRIPGAPRYRNTCASSRSKLWRTVEHKTHVEYQTLIRDLVLESEYLGD